MLLRFSKSPKKRRKNISLDWLPSKDIDERLDFLVNNCNLTYIKRHRVYSYRSTGAHTRAYARIWGLGRIFQQALEIEPAYVIEVISEKFDRLSGEQKDLVLIHELLHIPKTFSGALVPHKHKGGVNDRVVREVYNNMKRN